MAQPESSGTAIIVLEKGTPMEFAVDELNRVAAEMDVTGLQTTQLLHIQQIIEKNIPVDKLDKLMKEWKKLNFVDSVEKDQMITISHMEVA